MDQLASVHVAIDADDVMALIERGQRMRGLQRGMAAAGAFIMSKLATYPPQRPESQYRRTGTLGRRWTVQSSKGGLVITIGNNTSYAPRVQGPKQTEYFQKVGWLTPDDVVRIHDARIERIFNMYVEADL